MDGFDEDKEPYECGICQCCEARDRAINDTSTANVADDLENPKVITAAAHSVIRKRAARPQDWREILLAKFAIAAFHNKFEGSNIALEFSVMVVCSKCGNKRCPHAEDPTKQCTGSNDVGQTPTPIVVAN